MAQKLEIRPEEVDSIEDMGAIGKIPIKRLRLKGGLFVAIKSFEDKAECLGTASHPAILAYNIEKNHKDFAPILAKSDFAQELVTDLSELLPADLYEQNFDFHSIKKSESDSVSFHLTRDGEPVLTVSATESPSQIVIDEVHSGSLQNIKVYSDSVASAIRSEAESTNKKVGAGTNKIKVSVK